MAIVYKHIRLDTNEIFYIGIGKKISRAYSKGGRNKHWWSIVKKTQYKIEIIYEDLSVEEAKEKEILLIKEYGRNDLGIGTLVNMTDGGDGKNHSEETKKAIGDARRGKPLSEEHRKKLSESHKGNEPSNKGKPLSEEAKNNLREKHTGKTLSEEHKRKMSEAHKGVPRSEDVKKKISEGLKGHKNFLGRKHSEETKKKLSDIAKNRKNKSYETKRIDSAANS